MYGAIIGDVAGSIYEFNNIKTKDFKLFSGGCRTTDDSIMSLAIAQAILDCEGEYAGLSEAAVKRMRDIGRLYPFCGYGGRFFHWIMDESDPAPYNSFGNGAAMRISAVGWVSQTVEEAKHLSYKVTSISHDHPEGLKGAEAVAVAMVLAREGKSIEEIKRYEDEHYYHVGFTLDDIRETYSFDVTCQGSVPQALAAFYESEDYEDAIRNAISLGGDSDTIAAITGAIAEAFYGVPERIREEVRLFMDDRLIDIADRFEEKFGTKTV